MTQEDEKLVNRLTNLENQVKSLITSLESGSHPWGVLKASRVVGSARRETLRKVNISQSQLIYLYHECPQVLEAIAVRVSLLSETYQNPEKIYVQSSKTGIYWIIPRPNDLYWLIPKVPLKINPNSLKFIRCLFECQGNFKDPITYLYLIKPAMVSLDETRKKWQLIEAGTISVESSSIENPILQEIDQLKQELAQAKAEREELRSQLQIALNFLSMSPQQPPIPKNWQVIHNLTEHNSLVRGVILIDHQYLCQDLVVASCGYDNHIRLWEINSGKQLSHFQSDSFLNALVYSSPCHLILAGGGDNNIYTWNVKTGQSEASLIGHSGNINALVIASDGTTLASGSQDNTIKIWDLSTKTLTKTLKGHLKSVLALAITPDGQILASADANNVIKTWDLSTGKRQHTLRDHSSSVWSLAITPDGETLISGSFDKTIRLWDLATGEVKGIIKNSEDIICLKVSPDGQILVSSNQQGTLKIWNLYSKTLVTTLTNHYQAVYSLAISPDNQYLISASQDKTIKIWQSSY